MAGVNVGSASVTIIPTMSGFASGVAKEFGASGTQAGNSFASGLDKSTGKAKGISTKLAAIGGAAMAVTQTGITAAMGAISSSVSGAVSRVDTLNAFPRVLQGLGYSADEASAAVNKMSDHITGLPTTLDSITGSVQQILPSVGNVDKATNIMLAFNDALVAGGASTQVQEAALTQFTQVLAKGKPELEDWRSIQTAMPGQLDQVAKSMLGAGADSNQLYEALKAGTVTVDDFTAALVSLDSEGYGGFASFAEQAKTGTAGIATSFTNMKTAVVKNLGNVINAINNLDGSGNFIGNIIQGVTGKINAAGAVITNFLTNNQEQFQAASSVISRLFGSAIPQVLGAFQTTFQQVMNACQPALAKLTTALTGFAGKVLPVLMAQVNAIMAVVGSALATTWPLMFSFISSIVDVLGTLIAAILPPLVSLIGTFITLISKIVAAVMPALISLMNILQPVLTNLINTLMPALQNIIEIVAAVIIALMPVITAAVEWAANVAGQAIAAVINVISSLVTVLQGIITFIVGVFTGDWGKAWDGIKQICSGVWNAIKSLISGAMNIVKALIESGMNLVNVFWGTIWNAIADFLTPIWQGIKNGVKAGIDAVYNTVTSIKDSICNFFSGAGQWLYDSGKAILEGLGRGIQNAISGVKDIAEGAVSTIRNLFPFSPAKEGPFSGHGYTTYSGRALITDFARGAARYAPQAQRTISKALSSLVTTPSLDLNTSASVSGYVSRINAAEFASASENKGVVINLNGATLNDDAQMQNVALEFMQELLRINKMRKAGA